MLSLLAEEEVGEEVLHVLVELILRRQQNGLVVEEQQQQVEQEKQDDASHHDLSFPKCVVESNVLPAVQYYTGTTVTRLQTQGMVIAKQAAKTVGMLSSFATTPASAFRGFSKSDKPVRMP